jgi:hypothetical protein
MNASRKLIAYAAGLAAVFGASMVVGGAVDPTGLANAAPAEEHGGMADGMPEGMTLPGLATADDGLRLVAATDTQPRGTETPYRFRIVDDDGPVTEFDIEHTKRMHVIVVRRDFVGFQHVHPTMDDDGTWEIPVQLDDAGTYRVFADFVVDGDKHTLGTDLFVAGNQDTQPLPEHDHLADAGDGYTVEVEGEPVAGVESELEFVIRHDGKVITDVPEYLGARGHLVALRDGDLAYLHVHADEERLSFEADFPTVGAYRLFLQFQHDGAVRTAAFTVDVEETR